MIRGLSTHLLVNHRLNTVWLDRIWDAGVPLVEIFCARQHLDYRNKTQVSELGYWFRDSQLKLHSLHSPMFSDDVWGRTGPNAVLDITELVKTRRLQTVDEIKRAIEIAEIIPFRYLVQHLGVAHEEYDPRKLDAAFSALEELNLFAKERGVEILLENTPNEFSSAERLLTFLEATHLDMNFCLDVGHANMKEGVDQAFRLMKQRVRSTHIHDNNGRDDIHLFPTLADAGTIDWKRTMELLHSHGDQYPLVLELRDIPEYPQQLETAKLVFENLEKLTATL
jgi:sugar phosphate isomerase/epimerase